MDLSNNVFELTNSPIHLSQEEFNNLWEMKPNEAQHCKIFGKTIEVPRKYAVYGVQYRFSGQENQPIEVPSMLTPYLEYGNSILVNWYEDGSNYIGYHSDDEKGLSGCVYAFSYGAERRFKFQNKETKEVDTIMLPNNSLLCMKEKTQQTHKHSLPIMKKVKDKRISITVRTITNK